MYGATKTLTLIFLQQPLPENSIRLGVMEMLRVDVDMKCQ